MNRRQFALLTAAGTAAAIGRAASAPLKIGHRQASMTRDPGPGVFDLARRRCRSGTGGDAGEPPMSADERR